MILSRVAHQCLLWVFSCDLIWKTTDQGVFSSHLQGTCQYAVIRSDCNVTTTQDRFSHNFPQNIVVSFRNCNVTLWELLDSENWHANVVLPFSVYWQYVWMCQKKSEPSHIPQIICKVLSTWFILILVIIRVVSFFKHIWLFDQETSQDSLVRRFPVNFMVTLL